MFSAYANLLIMPWAPEQEWKNNVENELLPKAPDNIRLFYQLNYLHRRLIDGFVSNWMLSFHLH